MEERIEDDHAIYSQLHICALLRADAEEGLEVACIDRIDVVLVIGELSLLLLQLNLGSRHTLEDILERHLARDIPDAIFRDRGLVVGLRHRDSAIAVRHPRGDLTILLREDRDAQLIVAGCDTHRDTLGGLTQWDEDRVTAKRPQLDQVAMPLAQQLRA